MSSVSDQGVMVYLFISIVKHSMSYPAAQAMATHLPSTPRRALKQPGQRSGRQVLRQQQRMQGPPHPPPHRPSLLMLQRLLPFHLRRMVQLRVSSLQARRVDSASAGRPSKLGRTMYFQAC